MDNKNYSPFADPEFMSEKMLHYFHQKLEEKKASLLARLATSIESPQEQSGEKEDLIRFAEENELTMKASTRARLNQYLHQIELALQRIADRSYGFCAKTKCPISLRRLEIQPTALYSIEAQEQIEEQEEQEKLRVNLRHQENF